MVRNKVDKQAKPNFPRISESLVPDYKLSVFFILINLILPKVYDFTQNIRGYLIPGLLWIIVRED